MALRGTPACLPRPAPLPLGCRPPGLQPPPSPVSSCPGSACGHPRTPGSPFSLSAPGAAGCAAVESGKLVTWKVCRWCSAPLRMPCVQDFGPDAPRQRIPSRGPGLWRSPGMWWTAPDAEPRAAEGPGVGPA
ncbi:uncharacterized protein [Ciconia boyciana]|uniref:uncharacterized protein isoform X4 n=1 Tax=Ciconia boyciana TaxID=52775 RepID=UPI003B9ECAC5